jgi:hypothetical protein
MLRDSCILAADRYRGWHVQEGAASEPLVELLLQSTDEANKKFFFLFGSADTAARDRELPDTRIHVGPGHVCSAREPRHEGAGSLLLPKNHSDRRCPHLQHQGHLALSQRAGQKP